MRFCRYSTAAVVLWGFAARPVLAAPPAPTEAEVAAVLEQEAHANRIPSILLKGLAWRESRWRQWDETGNPIEGQPGHVGILGVRLDNRHADAERLKTDWRYNIAQGVKALVLAWNRAPIIGVGKLDAGRNILEAWYFALGRYEAGVQGSGANAFADAVLDTLALGGEGHWLPVSVSRPAPAQMAWGKNILGYPNPTHTSDVAPRPASSVVVSLPVPYLSQVYDAPDDFDGSGSCGPTAMLMALAFFGKVAPQPLLVGGTVNPHETQYGAQIPVVYARVCEPGRGAIHAKMLDYLRPLLPGAAIFYDEKATWERVKAELDAGRPCLLGTRVTPAGHIMVARGYLSDGRLLINDPAGDREQIARKGGPQGAPSPTGVRYWNGDGGKAVYDWDALDVRWVMTLDTKMPPTSDQPEDAK